MIGGLAPKIFLLMYSISIGATLIGLGFSSILPNWDIVGLPALEDMNSMANELVSKGQSLNNENLVSTFSGSVRVITTSIFYLLALLVLAPVHAYSVIMTIVAHVTFGNPVLSAIFGTIGMMFVVVTYMSFIVWVGEIIRGTRRTDDT